MKLKISLVIPAKGRSTRLRNKNLLKINGKSLVRIACEKALKCKNIDNVYLDTEDLRIVEESSDLFKEGLGLINRPKELATNFVGGNELIVYELHSIPYCDIIIHHYCTAPLIKAETIDRCIKAFVDAGDKYDSFFTVEELREYLWDKKISPMNFSPKKLPNSQDLEPFYRENHGLYGIKTSTLFKYKTRVGEKPLLIPISRLEAIDINNEEDLEMARRLKNGD